MSDRHICTDSSRPRDYFLPNFQIVQKWVFETGLLLLRTAPDGHLDVHFRNRIKRSLVGFGYNASSKNPENFAETFIYKGISFLERISSPKIDFLVKTQHNTRTDNRAMINIWLGCKRGNSYQKPARFPASLAGDLKGNKACSVSRQSCHLDCLHIMNPEVSSDCSSRKALPQRHLAGHCFKNSLCWTSWLPRLTPTRHDNEQVAWENKKTRAEPRNSLGPEASYRNWTNDLILK